MKSFLLIITIGFLFGSGTVKSPVVYDQDNPPFMLNRIEKTAQTSRLVTKHDSTFNIKENVTLKFVSSVFNDNAIQNLTLRITRFPTQRDIAKYRNNSSIALDFSFFQQTINQTQIKDNINIDYLNGFDIAKPLYGILIELKYDHQLIHNKSLESYLDRPIILFKK